MQCHVFCSCVASDRSTCCQVQLFARFLQFCTSNQAFGNGVLHARVANYSISDYHLEALPLPVLDVALRVVVTDGGSRVEDRY